MHTESHPLAGQIVMVEINDPAVPSGPQPYRIEDWWDKITNGSWMDAEGNPAALKYAMRSALSGLPLDDEVVYGKIGHYGHLVHVSELGQE